MPTSTDVVTGTVEAVSKFGIKLNGTWYNPDKRTRPSFSAVSRGDTVTLEVNPGTTFFVNVAGGTASPGTTHTTSTNTRSSSSLQMARSTALKASVEFVTTFKDDMNAAEAAARVEELATRWTTYILSPEEKNA